MAFIDFSQGTRQSALAAPAPGTRADLFTPIELRVLAIARHGDRIGDWMSRSTLARRLAGLLGIRRRPPLANPRLEALRRFAGLAIHHPERVRGAELDAILGAGFSREQIRSLLDGRGGHPAVAKPTRRHPLLNAAR
jgi:hypothetical protein